MAENPFSELPGAPVVPPGSVPPPIGHLHGLLDDLWAQFKAHWLALGVIGFGWFAAVGVLSAGVGRVETFVTRLAGFDDAWLVRQLADPAAIELSTFAGFMALKIPFSLVSGGLSIVIALGVYPLALGLARGEAPSIALITAATSRFPVAWAALFAVHLLMTLGYMACLVPGFFVIWAFMFTGCVAVDTQLGVRDSLRYAWRLLSGHRLHLFGLGLVYNLASIVIMLLTCGLGILPTLAASFVLTALAYVRLSGRTVPGLPDPVLD